MAAWLRAGGAGGKAVAAPIASARIAPGGDRSLNFLTLADETGHCDLVVRPEVYRVARTAIREQPLLCVEGVVQRQGQVVSVLVAQVVALGGAGGGPAAAQPSLPLVPARDWR